MAMMYMYYTQCIINILKNVIKMPAPSVGLKIKKLYKFGYNRSIDGSNVSLTLKILDNAINYTIVCPYAPSMEVCIRHTS